MKKKLILPLCVLLFSALAYGTELKNGVYGYSVDVPDGWEVLESAVPSSVSITDPDHTTVFQINSFDKDTYQSASQMYTQMSAKLQSTGDAAGFVYNASDAVFADLSFTSGNYPVRGYFLFLHGSNENTLLMAYTTVELYEKQRDFLISCLDSFSNNGTRSKPGPISQFYSTGHTSLNAAASIEINNTTLKWNYSSEQIDSSRVFLEREARILLRYTENRDQAWQRYYKMIYRDNYHRIDLLYSVLESYFSKNGVKKEDIPRIILEWIQGFTYSRSGTLSDLTSPLQCAVELAGDCDSLALLYVILLKHFDIDAILLVSSVYNHAMGAVDIAGDGARFPFLEKKYLVAEMTERVDLGMISQDMTDPANWIGISFHN